MPTVKINGIEVEVPEGTNMIEAAARVGVEIPHYCYHPNLSVAGNCRMCLVDVEAGGRGPDIACNMQARDGLAIRTDTEQVETMRRSVQEFLLKNHPLDCPICDQSGECRLQDYYMAYGQHASRLADEKVGKGKNKPIGEHIVLDQERCVACTRCVRFGDEVTGTGELRLFNRTDHTTIDIFPGEELSHDYQGNLADICPVGALTNRDFRFKKRVWYLKEADSVCQGCATGCNITVGHQRNEVFRFKPRRNDAVNKSWMCDFGRATCGDLTSMSRLLSASVEDGRARVGEAVAAAAAALKSGSLGVVFGARGTNEGNYALAQLVQKHLPEARCFLVEGNDPGSIDRSDELLLDPDKNPNRAGARLAAGRELEGADALKEAVTELDALLVLQDDIAGRLGLEMLPTTIYVGSWKNGTSRAAQVVLPASAAPEQDASWVNRDGRVQLGRRAISSAGDARPSWVLVDAIAGALGASVVPGSAAAVFEAFAGAADGLSGLTHAALGADGVQLGGVR